MLTGAQPVVYLIPQADTWQPVAGAVIEETPVCLFVNGRELTTIMASPVDLEALAVGFLFNEGIVHTRDAIVEVVCSLQGGCVDVWLHDAAPLPQRAIRTSGCGGGVTFDDLRAARPPVPAGAPISAQQVVDRYADLRAATQLYPLARGVHGSALCTAAELLIWSEDIGRHNTIDKLAGRALLDGIPTAGNLIVTTGRISSEMLGKAAKLGVAVVASRTSPTSRSLELARAWNITVIGYVRRDSFRLYTAPDRILQGVPAHTVVSLPEP